PLAGDGTLLGIQLSQGEREVAMGAVVGKGVDLTFAVREADPTPAGLYPHHTPIGQLRQGRHPYKRHRSSYRGVVNQPKSFRSMARTSSALISARSSWSSTSP